MAVAQGEPSLLDGVGAVVRRWRLVVAATLALVVGATVYAERLPPWYEASAVVAVTPRVEQSSADLLRMAAARFAAWATAPATLHRVAARLGEDGEGLQRQVDATVVPDTGNIVLTVRHRDRYRATAVANDLTDLLRRGSAADRLVAVSPIGLAVTPSSPAGPPRRLIEAAGLVVGLLLGAGLAALANALPRRRPAPGSRPALGRYPVVGELPTVPDGRASVADALADPAVDKAVGALTAGLAEPLGRELRGTVVVTAPGPRHGATTVARLLAAARLQAGARVLQVDGHGPGDLLEVVRAAGRSQHDCVVVDAPPVLGDGGGEPRTSAATALAPLADAVLLVVPPDARVDSLYRSIEAFGAGRGPFVGVVLNRAWA